MLLPEGVEQLIKAFARQPTPSASALQKAMQKDTSFVTISDKRAAAMCLSCRMPVRCSREWHIHPDGNVEMVFETHESCCGYSDDSDSEPEYVLFGVCDGLSEKSTWEVCWENVTGEMYYKRRHRDVREYVLKRLQDDRDFAEDSFT